MPLHCSGVALHSSVVPAAAHFLTEIVGSNPTGGMDILGHAVAQLVEALRYKSEGRGFDSRWYHWNFSLT